MNKLIIIGIVGLILFNFGCTEITGSYTGLNQSEVEKEELQKEIQLMNSEIQELNNENDELLKELIELEEGNEYVKDLKNEINNNYGDLKLTYNKLYLDMQNCYYANQCLYFPNDCVKHMAELFSLTGTAKEFHIEYSLACDYIYRDSEEYFEAYTGEKVS